MPSRKPAEPPGPLVVLLAEDNPADAEMVLAELRRAGLEVKHVLVPSADAFEKRLRDGRYDIVLTDYNLPGWSGADAIRMARQLAPEAPIIVVSGSLGDEGAVECLRQGATDYVLKHRLERLHLAVTRALRERTMRQEAAAAVTALRESEERFRGTFEQAAVGMAHLTLDGQWIQVNQRFCDILGYERDELLTKSPIDLSHPDHVARSNELGKAVMEGAGSPKPVESRLIRRDGSPVWVQLTLSMVRDPQGVPRYLMGVIEDINSRKQLESEFLQAQKMEAVGRLASGVAHDFNNVLTAIDGYGQLLRDDLAPDDPHRADVEEILHASKRAVALTRQLLAFSRRQVLEPQAIDLAEIVQGMGKMIRRLVAEHIEIDIQSGSPLPQVRVDPGQFEQVLLNLAINAADAMPTPGRLGIETAVEQLPNGKTVTTGDLPPGAYVTLSVSDTGGGIDAQAAPRIFEPFFTTKAPGKGTGLGLSTVYGIIKQSGGNIGVENRPGGGTVFRIYLPALEGEQEERTRTPVSAAAVAGAETVLVVEDEAPVRVYIRRTLERLGYSVIEATNGRDALRQLGDGSRKIDLVITDVVMPQMGGVELIDLARQTRQGLRALYVSGYAERDQGALDLSREGVRYLAKPFDGELLARKVREALDTPMSQAD
jgi:PAS domain S-box-containing protein